MIDVLFESPRLMFSTLAGVVLGIVGALVLHHFRPLAPALLGAAVVAGGLVVGLGVGAIWEARKS